MGQEPLIAVIDDDESFAALYTTILKDQGYRTLPVHRKDNLYDLVGMLNPWVILTGDGLEYLEEVRSNPFASHIPVIVATGRTDLVDRATLLGAFVVLLKPFGLDEFLSSIKRALRSRR